ncbi:MAG: sulfite exporter TauE/SafE family protein [Hyphomicrobiaceae bacterium]
MDWNTTDLVVAVTAAFLSSILGALSGFGAGILVMPFLVPLVGIKGVVPVMAVAMVIANIARIWVYRGHVRLDLVGPLILAIIPGVFVGTYIYKSMPVDFLAVFLGLFLIASIGLRRWFAGRVIKVERGSLVVGGFIFGVLTGTTPGVGVLLIACLLGMGLAGPALVGTDAVVGLLITFVRTGMFSIYGLIKVPELTLGIAIGLATFPGAFAARWMLTRLSAAVHVGIIEAMVVFAGASFLWRAWTA